MIPVHLPDKLVLSIDAGKAALEIVIHPDHFQAAYALLNGQECTLFVRQSCPCPPDVPTTTIHAHVE